MASGGGIRQDSKNEKIECNGEEEIEEEEEDDYDDEAAAAADDNYDEVNI